MKSKEDSSLIEPQSNYAQEKAAQLWCLPTTEKIVMEPALCLEMARVIDKYREALIWCSASQEFGINGSAREGWVKIRDELIQKGK